MAVNITWKAPVLNLSTINRCYGGKDNSGRTGLSSLVCKDEFPHSSYGPSLVRAGETCATK